MYYVHLYIDYEMKFTLKILTFIALLLISKLAKEDKLTPEMTAGADVIVASGQQTAKEELPVVKTIQQQETELPSSPMPALSEL